MTRYHVTFTEPRRAGVHVASSLAAVRAIVRNVAARHHGRRVLARIAQDGFAFGDVVAVPGHDPRIHRYE